MGGVISSACTLGFVEAKTASPRRTLSKFWQAHEFAKAKENLR